jgi:hypothetical protein
MERTVSVNGIQNLQASQETPVVEKSAEGKESQERYPPADVLKP